MEVITCGTKVRTKLGDIEAIITGVWIRYDYVNYELSYFLNGEYKQCWVSGNEIEVTNGDKAKIGFK